MTDAIDTPSADLVADEDRPELVGAPLGPGSLTWKYFGDSRLGLLGPRPAVLENMLPALGQAVMEHSVFFDDPFARIKRSLPGIYGTVYSPEGDSVGPMVRDFHTDIKGTMPDGVRYHALNPETYYWAHATFVDALLTGTDRMIKKLTDAEKEQIYAESITWYRRYGVSDRPMPATYADFVEYWDRTVDEVLIPHKTARYGVGYVTKGYPLPPGMHPLVWKVLSRVVNPFAAFITTGGMPERAREQLDLPWSERKERNYRRFCAGVRALDPLYRRLPAKVRYNKYALKGFAQAGVRP
ncbi:oxygenase MpaB family protein [Williamsia soli]|uniref:oxygenase MpaB family protein n=1 Tax=Williamsia soli TaxID=364929 RepID=UPI001A9E2493|nr:oxygenase MpaB family protein [Williamsia soli]